MVFGLCGSGSGGASEKGYFFVVFLLRSAYYTILNYGGFSYPKLPVRQNRFVSFPDVIVIIFVLHSLTVFEKLVSRKHDILDDAAVIFVNDCWNSLSSDLRDQVISIMTMRDICDTNDTKIDLRYKANRYS